MMATMLDNFADWRERHRWQWGLFVLAAALAFGWYAGSLPHRFQIPGDYVSIMNRVLLFVFAALGLTIVSGFTGLLHLGYGGFLCIGAFTTAILMKAEQPWTWWQTLPVGMAIAGAVAFVIGLPVLRLTGDYFAIVTFGFSELVALTARNLSMTGGTNGLAGVPEIWVWKYEWAAADKAGGWVKHEFFSIDGYDYWTVFLWGCILLTALVYKLKNSRIGRAWIAVREDELVAQCLGIPVVRFKMLAFVLSAAIGALAGSFMPVMNSYVSYREFQFMESSVLILSCCVLGGLGSIRGAILGGIAICSSYELLKKWISQPHMLDWAWLPASWRGTRLSIPADGVFIAFGLVLVLLMIFRPQGLISIRKRRRHARRRAGEQGGLFTLREPA